MMVLFCCAMWASEIEKGKVDNTFLFLFAIPSPNKCAITHIASERPLNVFSTYIHKQTNTKFGAPHVFI